MKFCALFPDSLSKCEYGDYCSFAHSQEEIMIDLLDQMEKDDDFYMFHFKTIWCPSTDQKHKKSRGDCVFAHNWQDFRRKPNQFAYTQEKCFSWRTEQFVHNIGDGCVNEFLCHRSHGWKEQEYHPNNYRTNPCRAQKDCKKAHCPYFHNLGEKRCAPPHGFRVSPINRQINSKSEDNFYLPHFIQSNSTLLLPYKQSIYHPSTGAFMNAMSILCHPFYLIHASMGFSSMPTHKKSSSKLKKTKSFQAGLNMTSSAFKPKEPNSQIFSSPFSTSVFAPIPQTFNN